MTDRNDNYTRADSTLTMDPPSDGLGNYTATNFFGISSNRGYSALGGSQAVAYLETNVFNLTVSATLTTVSTDIGVICRASATNSYLLGAWTTGVGFKVFENNAGSFTQRGSTTTGTFSANDILSLFVSGTTVVLSQNGTAKVTTTSSFNPTATGAGIRTHNDSTSRFSLLTTVAATSGAGIFRQSTMNGLSTAGPFFSNPIGKERSDVIDLHEYRSMEKLTRCNRSGYGRCHDLRQIHLGGGSRNEQPRIARIMG